MHKIGSIVKVEGDVVKKRIQKWLADPDTYTDDSDTSCLHNYYGQLGIVISEEGDLQQQVQFDHGYVGAFFHDELEFVRNGEYEYKVYDSDGSWTMHNCSNVYDLMRQVRSAILEGACRVVIDEA